MDKALLDENVADVLVRLTHHKGRLAAEEILGSALRHAGVAERKQYTADELATISDGLVSQGGLIELFGRNLRITALRRGAKLRPIM